jgi:hypothetical protein
MILITCKDECSEMTPAAAAAVAAAAAAAFDDRARLMHL